MDIEVRGGPLRVGIWGNESAPTVLAIHGITANHLAWGLIAEALPDLRIVAPDLRGRGRSSGLPGPYGFDQHADDLARLIDQLGIGPVPVVGHSMGGFVAVATAHRHPELISGVLLLDGGLPFVLGPDVDLDQVLTAALGPALERLDLTFDSIEAYRAFWRRHPALTDAWGPALIDYIDYDLTGDAPNLHSAVSAEAARTDGRQQFATSVDDQVLALLNRPMTMITAPRGLLGASPGSIPGRDGSWRALLPRLEVEELDDVNHYTMLMAAAGVAQIAPRISDLATASTSTVKDDCHCRDAAVARCREKGNREVKMHTAMRGSGLALTKMSRRVPSPTSPCPAEAKDHGGGDHRVEARGACAGGGTWKLKALSTSPAGSSRVRGRHQQGRQALVVKMSETASENLLPPPDNEGAARIVLAGEARQDAGRNRCQHGQSDPRIEAMLRQGEPVDPRRRRGSEPGRRSRHLLAVLPFAPGMAGTPRRRSDTGEGDGPGRGRSSPTNRRRPPRRPRGVRTFSASILAKPEPTPSETKRGPGPAMKTAHRNRDGTVVAVGAMTTPPVATTPPVMAVEVTAGVASRFGPRQS